MSPIAKRDEARVLSILARDVAVRMDRKPPSRRQEANTLISILGSSLTWHQYSTFSLSRRRPESGIAGLFGTIVSKGGARQRVPGELLGSGHVTVFVLLLFVPAKSTLISSLLRRKP